MTCTTRVSPEEEHISTPPPTAGGCGWESGWRGEAQFGGRGFFFFSSPGRVDPATTRGVISLKYCQIRNCVDLRHVARSDGVGGGVVEDHRGGNSPEAPAGVKTVTTVH